VSDHAPFHENVPVLYVALGDFTVAFSEMIAAMRDAAIMLLEAPTDEAPLPHARNPLFDTLFETLSAAPISRAYFACVTSLAVWTIEISRSGELYRA
jgi:hypothetical protein